MQTNTPGRLVEEPLACKKQHASGVSSVTLALSVSVFVLAVKLIEATSIFRPLAFLSCYPLPNAKFIPHYCACKQLVPTKNVCTVASPQGWSHGTPCVYSPGTSADPSLRPRGHGGRLHEVAYFRRVQWHPLLRVQLLDVLKRG